MVIFSLKLSHQLACSAAYSYLSAFPPVIYRHSETPLESTLEKVPQKTALTTFRMNTYEKEGEGGPVIVN
jgi:hypothetical protein